MPCNYLVKFEKEEKYEHMIIEGCSNSNANQAAIRHFTKSNKGLNPKSFDQNSFEGVTKVWVLSAMGVAYFEELFEITTGPVRFIKDPTKGFTEDNMVEGLGWNATKVEEKPPKLLPGLENLVS